MLHTCVHTQSSLRCIANVYEYTLRIGFHRSTHVYIHKTQLALHCTCVCVYTQDQSSPLHTCVHTQELVMLHTCVHIQSSLRCIANVYEYTLRIGFHRSTHVYIHKAAYAALHMCMNIHSGSVFTASRMCTYTNAARSKAAPVYVLRCTCVYTYVYIHKHSLRCVTHAYMQRNGLRRSTLV